MHSREGGLSAFEVACFPEVDLSSRNFEMVLRYSSIEKASQGNDFFDGCSPLHLTAGFFGAQGSVWKLNRLVQFGLNCNFPVEATGKPPLLFHILHNSFNTAETLLELGADPWIADNYGWDAPLTAVGCCCSPLLRKIATVSTRNSQPPNWERTFKAATPGHLPDISDGWKCASHEYPK